MRKDMVVKGSLLKIVLAGFVLFGLVSVSGCSKKAVNEKVVKVKAEQPQLKATVLGHPRIEDDIHPRAYDFFTTGLILQQMGNFPKAAGAFKSALQFQPDSYEIRFSLADAYFTLGQFDKTIATLDSITPEDENVYILRAAAYTEMGQDKEARNTYLELIKKDPRNTMAYSHLAGFYRQIGQIDSLIWAYQNLAQFRPDNERILRELGRLQAQRGDYRAARDSFRQSIEARPDETNVPSYLGLAELYIIAEDVDSASVIYKQVLELEPFNVIANRELMAILVRADSVAAALEHARRVVAATPLDRDAVRRLAVLYFSLDSLETADSIFTYLVNSGERNAVNHYYRGRIGVLRKDWEQAVEQFTVLTQLADTLYESWLDLGYSYGRKGDRQKEILTYRTGLNHVKDEQGGLRLMFAMGAAYEQNGQVDEAVAIFEEVIAKSPDHAQALNYLGYMLADRGERLDYARQLIERAIKIAPENAAYLDSYGWVFYRLQEFDEALVYLRKAVALESDPIIYDHLGDAHNATGDVDSARVWWQKALDLEPENETIRQKLDSGQ